MAGENDLEVTVEKMKPENGTRRQGDQVEETGAPSPGQDRRRDQGDVPDLAFRKQLATFVRVLEGAE